jgi:ferrous iron transport protein A
MPVQLNNLPQGITATVHAVEDTHDDDSIARRLRELGFVAGEAVRVVAKGPLGGDPLLVRIGGTRFALRCGEAARVRLCAQAAP